MLPILNIPAILFLSEKETMIIQLNNYIVTFFLDIYHSKFPPWWHAFLPICLDRTN